MEEVEDGAALPSDVKLEGPLPPAAYADNTPTKFRRGSKRCRDAHIDAWTTLRMNKHFMKLMRKKFPNLIRDAHPKLGMPVTVQEVMSLRKRAGLLDNLGEIPDEGGRGPECVTPGLPSHDCILLVKPRNRRYRQRPSSRRSPIPGVPHCSITAQMVTYLSPSLSVQRSLPGFGYRVIVTAVEEEVYIARFYIGM